ncbi:hypothetical protein C2S52_003174 [Perilla frutescens var. hirtella]|nr:hypothetical protein C2S52_003174 [Perilla frutescens var. hirtella]
MFCYILSLTLILPVFSDLAADRSALLRLQPAIGGRTLRWNTTGGSSPCSSWRGVKCNVTTGRVIELRLPGAGLRGQLPPDSIGNLTELRVLSLRNNALSGQLPSDLAACTLLEEIHLQGNTFSGEIPESFFTLTNLLRVNFAGNNFSGDLSPEFNKLIELRTLYLENNSFSGSFPNWDSLTNLRNFNVSFNGLMTGSIPSILGTFSDQSFIGTSLCGKPLDSCSSSDGNKQLSNGAIAGIVVGSAVAFLAILFASFVLWRTYRSRKVLPQRSPIPRSPAQTVYSGVERTAAEQYYNRTAMKNVGGDGLVFLGKDVEGFSLQELLSASAEAMGKGTVGSTYKAYFESGTQVIVKRLNNVCVSELDFRAKIEEIGSLLHQNLLPLKGYFYGREEKLLIYDPMPKGSLSTLLHGYGENKRFLSLEMRGRIAMGTASAIEYLHSISPKTTHGNIKASNVFVNDYYEARVSEMGLTQVVSGIANLNGYRAPEVTDTRSISQQADVYSVGVVVLELVTGREPDKIVREEGIELPNWVQAVVEEKGTTEVIDQDLLSYHNHSEDQLVQLLLLALSCTSRHPLARPSAPDLTRRLHKICAST